MPSTFEQLEEKQAESLKLLNLMLDPETGLEARIKKLEAGPGGAADFKEQVQKAARDNAEAIEQIKTLTEKLRDEEMKALKDELHERQDAFETKYTPAPTGGDGAAVDIAAPIVKALPAMDGPGLGQRGGTPILGFNEKVKADVDAKSLLQRKTVTSLSSSGGDLQIPIYEPNIIAPGEQPITLLDILPMTMTESPLVFWVVEVLGSRTNGTTIQSLDFTGTGQGDALGLVDFVFNQLSAETRTFGGRAKIALQMLEDVDQVRGYMENVMRYLVRFDAEDQIVNGDGTGTNITGLKVSATAYDATLDNTLGVTNVQELDVLALAILQCALTFHPATAILLHQYEATAIQLLKDAEQRYLFVNNPNQRVQVSPWGIPIVQTTQQAQGDFTVGAFNFAEVMVRKGVTVELATENSDDFDKLLASIRAHGRFGLKLYRPGSLIDGDFATAKA